ncbi:MAG: hypothetical protein EGP83_07160 [Clostridiales bacterium]|jgi:hypothetical protein|nr:hypothetical protein [Clostridiales bacterium]DAI40592.1 MAG TPA: hypothetical protein [Caudoviricetes sp.]
MENEALTLRRLRADDLFTMMRILSKIGVEDLRAALPGKTTIQRVREGNESAETVGVTVALTIADKLLSRLPDCKNEIYTLLADVSGKTPAEIAALDMGVFAEAVFDLMASEDFRDFFTRLMKRLGQTK